MTREEFFETHKSKQVWPSYDAARIAGTRKAVSRVLNARDALLKSVRETEEELFYSAISAMMRYNSDDVEAALFAMHENKIFDDENVLVYKHLQFNREEFLSELFFRVILKYVPNGNVRFQHIKPLPDIPHQHTTVLLVKGFIYTVATYESRVGSLALVILDYFTNAHTTSDHRALYEFPSVMESANVYGTY
jgi:hypothetical protein